MAAKKAPAKKMEDPKPKSSSAQKKQVTSNIPSVYQPGNAVSLSQRNVRTEPTKIKNSNPSKPSLGYSYTQVASGKPATSNEKMATKKKK